MRRKYIPCGVLLLAGVAAWGADVWKLPKETASYKPGPGVVLAMVNCTLCHSADYLSTQPPMTRAAWKATVEKMRTRYGALIQTNDVERLADYLAAAYSSHESSPPKKQ